MMATSSGRLDKVIEFSLCAMIFTLPFSKSMVEIFFSLALACWIAKRWIRYSHQVTRSPSHQSVSFREKVKERISGSIKAFKPVETDLNIPVAGFVFVGFLATVNSISFLLSLEGFFLKLFEWIMIYFIVAESVNTKEKINRILLIILMSAFLISIDGIFQAVTGTDFLRNYSAIDYAIRASFDNPNGFGGWLIVMLLLTVSLAYFSKNSKRPMLWILACLLIFCLASTYSRGAWIVCFLSLIFLGLISSKKLFVIMLITLLILPFIVPDSMKRRADSITKISRTNVDRFTLWQEALNITADFPVLGTGLNTYASIAPRYKIREKTGVYPHNCYLQMAAESGLLGLGAFVWIMITLFRTSFANLKKMQNRFYSAILIGLLVGLFGFLAHSFVDVNIYTLQLGNLMWFVMGLIIAVQKVSLQDKNLD